ncbi:MAG: NAD-dependent DNA ligase LigA [Chitinophagales bacterium]
MNTDAAIKQKVTDLLNRELVKEDLNQIKEVISYLDQKYYVDSETLVEDFEYDKLFDAVKKIETNFPELVTENSPTQRVAKALSSDFSTVVHSVPMLSLNKSYNNEDIESFDESLRKLISEDEKISYSIEPKFDGSSIALLYENDVLVRAATRGDGTEGEDITQNAKMISNIPQKVNFSKFGISKIELRGEVVIEHGVFKNLNQVREKEGLKAFENSRNTASGSLRMKDPNEVAKRGLEAFIYQVGYMLDLNGDDILNTKFEGQSDIISWLGELGFQVPKEETAVFSKVQDVINFCFGWEEKRNNYNYEIDGMVIKLNNIRLQNVVGHTAHHPRWAIAFKFKARQATTQLLNIEYQVGRTGAVTPVAKLDPVRLAGVTVSSVSLHNEEFIKEKDIHINDFVFVERAGDVIPYISGVDLKRRKDTKEVVFPKECPSCQAVLSKPENEAIWRCENLDCSAQVEERIIHFVSKGAMNIDGLGKDIVKRFISEGFLETVEDIYELPNKEKEILALEGWKEKSFLNLKNSIENSKNQAIWRLIVGLGIRHIGSTTAKNLAKQVNSIFDFKNWEKEKLEELEDIGPKVAESISLFFNNEKNILLLQKLAELGLKTEKTQEDLKPLSSDALVGSTFLFTGTLTLFSRTNAKELVEENGGKNISSVSKNLNYLVVGEKAGSKLKKAEKINKDADQTIIKIISEQEFLDLIA